MTVESTLRGAGRNASGSTVGWYRTVEWLLANGPATLDEIIAGCADFIDAGYVRRAYAKHLQGVTRPRNGCPGLADPGSLDIEKARRWWLQKHLRKGVTTGAVVRSGDTYKALRLPRSPAGLSAEQITADPVAQRKAMTEQQLIATLLRIEANLISNQGKVDRAAKDVLLAWLEARRPTYG